MQVTHDRLTSENWNPWSVGVRGAFVGLVVLLATTVGAAEPVDYLTQIKPILRERCFACHGALKQEAQLRLDTASLAKQGGESGAAITPGETATSLLLKRVTAADESERMPPAQEGEPLTESQVSLLKRWIAEGAKGPPDEQPESDPAKHWAFQPIVRPAVPRIDADSVRNPIDAFLQKNRQQRGIQPQPEAPRIVLLRRLHLDLIGIPPTREEITACEADTSPQWYEKTVQRLLDDPRHGERWARHWMDVWRYSDWWGLGDQLRNSQKHIWHWRDWIVESLNEDTPYDEMVRLMLAADELHPNDLNKLRATGYLARNYWLFNRPQWMEETVEHVSKGFLGLTMNCARCHDHKYDPLEQADYYRLRAFFEPYHVRMDVVPGEADLTRDGIPRAFDGLLEEPTYRYIRGDERNPDKSRVITPGIPALLAFDALKIQPVSLPAEAWQPERRAWVLDAQATAAQSRLNAAIADRQKAQEKLDAAKKLAAELPDTSPVDSKKPQTGDAVAGKTATNTNSPILVERFESLQPDRWKLFGGEWKHEPGKLSQKMDGANRASLRWLGQLPTDFDVSMRFTIHGGSKWRSVGMAFDVSQADPTQAATSADSEQNVYVSAVAGGSKIQAAYHRGGQWQYPTGTAMRSLPIEINRLYTLRVQVRGRLINASLDGEPLITFETPLERRAGSLQVTTFDALATIHEVAISGLDPKIALRAPMAAPATKSKPMTKEAAAAAVAAAQQDLTIAELAVAVAQSDAESVSKRIAAHRVDDSTAAGKASEAERAEVIAAAVRAERQTAVAKARQRVAVAEQAVQRAASDKKEAAEKGLKAERESLEKLLALATAEVKPTDAYTRFVGAMWTPTRFFNSGKDDPEVKFQPQSSGRRTALANWITDRRNPLAARVAVNHLWMRHMGQPLVPTVFDFGRKGTPPTQPELLDWLASEFMDHGWSMKHLHAVIVNSAAYRMSSSLAGADVAMARDPENHFWWRRVPIRMESQLVRDSLLSMAGVLDATRGGPSVPAAQQATSTRRSLYFFHSNNERNLFLTMFDEALVKDCYRREQSIVPQQALALSNSQLALDAADQIAKRLSEPSVADDVFVRDAFRVVTGIQPSKEEVAASLSALEAWAKLPNGSTATARAHLVWALINHNDFVTLR
jgi:mono/diheme cytochrome c family protein